MKYNIWVENIFDDNGNLTVGGVQTYTAKLYELLLSKTNEAPLLVMPNCKKCNEFNFISMPLKDWKKGKLMATDNDCVNIVMNIHKSPKKLNGKTFGIQHGVYWDANYRDFGLLGFIKRKLRVYKAIHDSEKFSKIITVDANYPNVWAAIKSKPIDFNKFEIIPNFAEFDMQSSDLNLESNYTYGEIDTIVFSRRFVEHRGVIPFVESVEEFILKHNWKGVVKIYGDGPLQQYILDRLSKFDNVSVGRLKYEERLSAFSSNSLVFVPTSAAEGTSLSCIEAWSKHSLVVSTVVGGLSNMCIDGFNSVVVKPTRESILSALEDIFINKNIDVDRIRMFGFNTFYNSFNDIVWSNRIFKVLGLR
ncbi:glycosyltransferase family 4 protein [Vibrio mimicus]